MRAVFLTGLMLFTCIGYAAQDPIKDEIFLRSQRQSHILQKRLNLTEHQRCTIEMIISDIMFAKYKESSTIDNMNEFFNHLRKKSFSEFKVVLPYTMHAKLDSLELKFAAQAKKRKERITKKLKRKAAAKK